MCECVCGDEYGNRDSNYYVHDSVLCSPFHFNKAVKKPKISEVNEKESHTNVAPVAVGMPSHHKIKEAKKEMVIML